MAVSAATEPGAHRVPRSVFEELCSGPVTQVSMDVIRAGQHSLRRLRLLALFEFASLTEAFEGAWATLVDVEDRRPDVVADVLMCPAVGVWLTRALQGQEPTWSEFAYLYSLVAAVAIRAGEPCVMDVPIADGIVSLPTVGHVRIPWQSDGLGTVLNLSTGSVSITSGEKSITFVVGVPSPGFTPVTKHLAESCGVRLEVEINDTDPYREFEDPLPPRRLTPAELATWHALLDEAWSLLTERHKGYALELSGGLGTLVPIRPERHVASASCSAAFGGVALSTKYSPAALAEVLVHELQHSKLNALVDLVPLLEGSSDSLWYAPWRADARPLMGALHGIYAFVSVVEFWRIERDLAADPGDARAAQFTFAYRRNQVREAVEGIRPAPELTDLGRQLVDAVSDRVTACEADEVPEELLEIVRRMADDSRATWRIRHMRYDDAAIELVVRAWLDGESQAPSLPSSAQVRPDLSHSTVATRTSLFRAKAVDPDQFRELVGSPDDLGGTTPHADVALVLGRYGQAANAYLARIQQAADDTHAWAGLSLTSDVLSRSPELVFAIHSRVLVLTGQAPDPLELAAWIA